MKSKMIIAAVLAVLLLGACASDNKEALKNFLNKTTDKMESLTTEMAKIDTAAGAISIFKKAGSTMAALRKEQRPLQKKFTRSEIKDDPTLNNAYMRWATASRALTGAARSLNTRFKNDTDVEKAYQDYRNARSSRKRRTR